MNDDEAPVSVRRAPPEHPRVAASSQSRALSHRALAVLLVLVVSLLWASVRLLGRTHEPVLPASEERCSFCFSNALSSHAVLQRAPASASLWGFSSAGDEVECTLHLSDGAAQTPSVRTRADLLGRWVLSLPPQPAGGPHSVHCASRVAWPGHTATLEDVLFGDVFLCAGQSNMAFPAVRSLDAADQVEASANLPRIRLLSVGKGTRQSPKPGVPLAQFGGLELPWSVAGPETVGAADYFSAVCWSAGRRLYDTLQGAVPVGLIVSAWGGTCVEQWSPDAALTQCSQPAGQGRLFDALIAPLAPHMRLAGVLYYQGESNVGTAEVHGCGAWGASYACAFKALVQSWRVAFQDPKLFFAFVQLAPYVAMLPGSVSNNTALAVLRAAQAAALTLPRTAMVSAIDLGDAESPFRDIHPRGKSTVGERLADAAAAALYRLEKPVSPFFAHASRVAGKPLTLLVRLDAASVAGGLVHRPAVCPHTVHPVHCRGWELQLADGSWHEARVVDVRDDGVMVAAIKPLGDAAVVTGVQYAWASWPLASLFSRDGLPVLPFRSSTLRDEEP